MHEAPRSLASLLLLCAAFAVGCSPSAKESAPPSSAGGEASTTAAAVDPSLNALPSQAVAVGSPAPEFTLRDLDGKDVALSQFKGKTVVLEWFNPECPFVKNAHTKGSLVDTAKTWSDKGVVWLAINSSAEGKQGFGVETNRQGVAKFQLSHPVLLDPSGKVGKAYGATNTPHLVVIRDDGTIAYRGAIDNSPDGEGDSPEGGVLINYAAQALHELANGKPVSTPETKAYGCGVKYGG